MMEEGGGFGERGHQRRHSVGEGRVDSPEQVVEEGGVDAGVNEQVVAQALREFVLGMRSIQTVREPTRR